MYQYWNMYANMNYCTKYSETEIKSQTTSPALLTFVNPISCRMYYALYTERPTSGDNNGALRIYHNTDPIISLNTSNAYRSSGYTDVSFATGDYVKVMPGYPSYQVMCIFLANK